MATCYRHPGRETGVSCSNCGRPICPDCMTPTSVGMRCPECARQKTKVVRGPRAVGGEPRVTVAIIIVCVIAFLASGNIGVTGAQGNEFYFRFVLQGTIGIHIQHDYWRLVTGAFLHANLIHIGFNMYLLWLLGQQLESVMGSTRFGTLYFTALLCGTLGALAQTSETFVVGASGAVFGLMGATAVELRRRGLDPFAGGLGGMIVINLVIGFIPSFHVAWGGHVGGLIGGALAGLAFHQADRLRQPWLGYVGCALLAAIAIAGSIVLAGNAHNYTL
jgi:membrane associated rhomboid family serine protease